jgi:RHS repeat-associated protein
LLATKEKPASGPERMTVYTYDPNGNMIWKGAQEIKKIDPMNPPTATVGNFTFGQGGTSDPIVTGTVKYEYNVWNQLIRSTSGNRAVEYAYNGEGYRVSKTASGHMTRYMYEYDKVVLEVDAEGNQTARSVYGINLIARTITSETVYYLYNGHADVMSLVDSDGKVRATFDYDAFGTPIDSAVRYYDCNGSPTTSSGKIDSPIRYAGYQYDSETGLYYLNSRYYDSKIARFLSEDTYRGKPGDPLSLNLYTYSHNEPIMYYDPSGKVTLKSGTSGDSVKKLQEELNKAGFNVRAADGKFGPKTQQAVIAL